MRRGLLLLAAQLLGLTGAAAAGARTISIGATSCPDPAIRARLVVTYGWPDPR
jgi:hypothetical protein